MTDIPSEKYTSKGLIRLFYFCRLHRPADIPLLLLPGVAASLLAAEGMPQLLPMLLLLGAALLFRCAAWVFNDWMEARLLPEATESFVASGVVTRQEAQRLLAALLLGALLLILPLGLPLLYYAAAAPLLLAGFPYLKTRLLLTQPYLGLCYAWLVPMAWSAQEAVPAKGAWLFFTAVMLSATAFNTLQALSRRSYEQKVGIRSLALLFGEASWVFVLMVQASAVVAFWLAGRQLDMGIFFTLGLVTVLLLLPYQQWLLLAHPKSGAIRSYYTQIWSSVAVVCGTAFHFICVA